MPERRVIGRRGFLIGSAAIAGGVAFGVRSLTGDWPNPLEAGPGRVPLTPYILLTGAGITIIVPRAEMGQGVQTTLAALVAEEMDLPWGGFEVAHGPASGAYHNARVASLGLPIAEYRPSRLREIGEDLAAFGSATLGMQVTGGSTSTVDAFDKMRRAGAAARHVVLEAAAARLGLGAETLRTEDGAVIGPSGERLAYTDLAEAARGIAVPDDPPLKPRAEWRHLGRAMPRTDMVAKTDGTARYGMDTRIEGMRYAAIHMAPRPGARLLGADTTALDTLRGIEKVVEFEDAVAVIADNTWRAMRALAAIEPRWSDPPAPEAVADTTDTEAVFATIARAFEIDANATLRDDGDVDEAALASAPGRIEAEYRAPYLAHATMEPMNATARLAGGKLELWVGNQAPMAVRDHAARALGLAAEAVTVHTPLMGGGFGRRAETDVAVQAARIAAAMPGTAVKLTWTREEDMRHDFYRPGAIAHMAGVPSPDGPRSLDIRIAAPSVLRSQGARLFGFAPPGPDKLLVEGAFDQPYAIPNYRVRGHIADLPIPVGSWRSVGHSHNAFFHECFLDEVIVAGGGDPVETRLALIRPESAAGARVLETVAEMANWGAPLPAGTGRGVAFSHAFGTPTALVIEVREDGDRVRISHVWCAQDVGIALDPGILEAQAVSGIVFGLSAAVMGEITFEDGAVVEGNFDRYDALRLGQMPRIEVRVLSEKAEMSGAGEPATPPAAPALVNAIFDLTGKRYRSLPLSRHLGFV